MVISYMNCPFNLLAIQSLSVKTFLFQKMPKYTKTAPRRNIPKHNLVLYFKYFKYLPFNIGKPQNKSCPKAAFTSV